MIISLSGGADSSTLLLYALTSFEQEPIQPICFNYEQRHKKEIDAARFLCMHYRLKFGPERVRPLMHVRVDLPTNNALTNPAIEVPPLERVVGHPQPPTYVPFRNLIFASHCLALAEAYQHSIVALGIHKSDMYGYWDTTSNFVLSLEELANLNRAVKIRIWTPFLNFTKADIIAWGLAHQLPYQYTWSCYEGSEKPCLVCATCRERVAAFEKAGVEDPLLCVASTEQ